ncbi:MAG: zinc finger domain-containing protein [Candidatus Verstraetearchaeota archaeon]|jgi:predicted RNA-binding Zn-ribbon protein involved in translation (DUF1610 family)|nr:zinc finger domain-containing protein [Candidatus Verstraetearchaeota archaeon]
MSNLELPICSSCRSPILPHEKGVKMFCPNCGETVFWRCRKCRILVNSYKCVKCGFVGP